MRTRLTHPGRPLMLTLATLLAAAALATACTSTPPAQPTPPVGSLPDPARLMPAAALAALFGNATVSEPSCRYAESNYRCTWTDLANPDRAATVTVYADTQRATQQMDRSVARSVDVPGASRAAVVSGASELDVWAIVGELGVQVSVAPDTGNVAAIETAAVALTAAFVAAMSL